MVCKVCRFTLGVPFLTKRSKIDFRPQLRETPRIAGFSCETCTFLSFGTTNALSGIVSPDGFGTENYPSGETPPLCELRRLFPREPRHSPAGPHNPPKPNGRCQSPLAPAVCALVGLKPLAASRLCGFAAVSAKPKAAVSAKPKAARTPSHRHLRHLREVRHEPARYNRPVPHSCYERRAPSSAAVKSFLPALRGSFGLKLGSDRSSQTSDRNRGVCESCGSDRGSSSQLSVANPSEESGRWGSVRTTHGTGREDHGRYPGDR